MCSLYPKCLCGCPGLAFSVQLRFVQTTDKAGVSELRSSTSLARRCFEGLKTDTRTKGSSCARVALAEGLPMTEFLRARRDLTLIGVSMDKVIDGGRWSGSSRSQCGRLDSLHLDLNPVTKMLQKMAGWNTRLGARTNPQAETPAQPAGNSVSLHLHLSDRNYTSINTCPVATHCPSLKRLVSRPIEEGE